MSTSTEIDRVIKGFYCTLNNVWNLVVHIWSQRSIHSPYCPTLPFDGDYTSNNKTKQNKTKSGPHFLRYAPYLCAGNYDHVHHLVCGI